MKKIIIAIAAAMLALSCTVMHTDRSSKAAAT